MTGKKNLLMILIVLFVCALILPACSPQQPSDTTEDADQSSVEDLAGTVIARTVVVETAVSGTMTALAPPPTATNTPTDTPTPTNTPTTTPTPTDTPTPIPTSFDPYSDPWCTNHLGCEKVEVKSNLDCWVSIFLVSIETDIGHLYSIPPRGHVVLTIKPGQYRYTFTYCEGEVVEEGYHAFNARWYLHFKSGLCD